MLMRRQIHVFSRKFKIKILTREICTLKKDDLHEKKDGYWQKQDKKFFFFALVCPVGRALRTGRVA